MCPIQSITAHGLSCGSNRLPLNLPLFLTFVELFRLNNDMSADVTRRITDIISIYKTNSF